MIFVDTWAWLALAHKRDPYHSAAVQQHRAFQKQKAQYVTSDYVLGEFMTPLFGVLNFAKAQQFSAARRSDIWGRGGPDPRSARPLPGGAQKKLCWAQPGNHLAGYLAPLRSGFHFTKFGKTAKVAGMNDYDKAGRYMVKREPTKFFRQSAFFRTRVTERTLGR